MTSLVSSILSLTLVACDRFFGIVFAMKAHIIERKAKPVIIAVWVISVAVASPLLVYRRVHERHWKNHVERWCDDSDWSIDSGDGESHFHKPSRVAYWTFVSVILFFIPIIAMIGAYCGIIKTLWSTKIPGERVYKENLVQNKMKRKVLNRLFFYNNIVDKNYILYQIYKVIQGNIFNCPLIQYTIDKIKSTKYDVTFTQVFRCMFYSILNSLIYI